MIWKSLISSKISKTLPWYGFITIHSVDRSWTISGDLPPEHGWYEFVVDTGGRFATLSSKNQVNIDYSYGSKFISGYIVGNRFIHDNSRIDSDPDKLVEQTEMVYCVERGLDHIARASVIRDRVGCLIFMRQEFSLGPESDVLDAIKERLLSVDHIKGVTPALDLAFRWVTDRREKLEEHRRRLQILRDSGTAVGRRHMVGVNLELAVEQALKISGAELLDVRDSYNVHEKIIQYRFRNRRFECVVDDQLKIVDSGVCLTDHNTGEKGDSYFTLESLPGVVGEAIDRGVLVVYRHVDI